VDSPRLAALLSDNLDETGSPLLRLDAAAWHAPTGAVLPLPWWVGPCMQVSRGGRAKGLEMGGK
jgi:hypothetical protein